MNILTAISQLISPPQRDPKRFAAVSEYIPNWNGENVGMRSKGTVNDRVHIDDTTRQVEFTDGANPYSGIDIPAHLTDKDVEWIRGKKLDPNNPKYTKAKAFFSLRPWCNKEEMAEASGIAAETAKDLIPGFKRAISHHSPTD